MNHPVGQLASLLAALAWAGALVLFKRSGERVPPIPLNLFKNAVGITLLALTLLVTSGLDYWCGLFGGACDAALFLRLSLYDYLILVASGIIGIAVADTFFFHALNLIGVGLVSIVDCCYSPSVLLFAWLLLGEDLSPYHYLGGGLILLGVLIASGHAPPPGHTRAQILLGICLGMLAISSMAFGIVIATPVLKHVPLVWATTVRLIGGSVALLAVTPLLPGAATHWAIFKPARVWYQAIPAAFLGTYLSLLAWIAGFKYTYASVAAVLNQTSIIFALILASIFLRERFGTRKLLAVELALGGVLIITFPDHCMRLAERPGLAISLAAGLIAAPIWYQWRLKRLAPAVSPAVPPAPLEKERIS
jgi:drug/metabolite transporter (DMT)-like permease